MADRRDVAVVLSGGSINGVMMELGFLQRLRESPLWPRLGWIFGTSAGALAGSLAALDRLDELERFLLGMQPNDVFRPNRLWRLPLLGTHDYTLPQTIEERIGPLAEVAAELRDAPVELVVSATDVTDTSGTAPHDHELVFSSRSAEPEVLAQAIVASAAISTLVLPLRVGTRLATDGAWARNYPLGHAYHRPGVELIAAFRYVARYPSADGRGLRSLRRRLERIGRVPPVAALVAELREAEERAERGEPPHLVDVITRLMRVSVLRSTLLEERVAAEKDASIRELGRLRADVATLLAEEPGLAGAVDRRFAETRFPFGHDRLLPRITVRGSFEGEGLVTGYRVREWPEGAKRRLIARGYELADAELARHGVARVHAAASFRQA